jgi:glycosyltransferase involved in cell wall biosynthesis
MIYRESVITSAVGAIRKSNNMPPLVSVIIPAFNSAQYMADAVESVFAQTYSEVECIVVDDGSTDRTNEILKELLKVHPGLKTARKTNGGPSSARNMGLRESTGDFISFLDADDVLLPDKIERQVAFLDAHPDVGLVYGDSLIASETLRPVQMYTTEMPRDLEPIDALCYRNWFGVMDPLVRRAVTDRIGKFDEELAGAEDWDYWIRSARVARISYLAGAVSLYRQHAGQAHHDYFRTRRDCIRVATKQFGDDPGRLRGAMAAIQWAHARYLWSRSEKIATAFAVAKFAVMGGLGFHVRYIAGSLEKIVKSQLKPV